MRYNKRQRTEGENRRMQDRSYNQKRANAKKQLYYIFTYYCSFADRENYQSLKIQNFRRLLTDAQLISNNNANIQMELDLLFAKFTKNTHGVGFETFLVIIPEISKLFFGEDNCEQGVKKLVNENFHALYQFIFQSTEFGESIRYLSKTSYSQGCFVLLKSLSSTIYRIYLHYFDISSIKIVSQRAEIFQKLTAFTKNFDITPQLLTKTESFLIFNYVLDEEGESVYKQWFEVDKQNKHGFIFFDFIRFLFIVSLTANRKSLGVEVSQLHKLVYFLQMLEVSNGFAKFCKTQQINLHLIPDKKLLKGLEAKNNSFAMSPLNLSPVKQPTPEQAARLDEKLMGNYSGLRQKFISFCLHGETIGNSNLSHKKLINIFMDMKLGLRQSEIQVYLAGSKKPIQFETFVQLLQKISQKQMIQLPQIIEKFQALCLNEQIEHERLKTSRTTASLSRKQYRNCIAMIEIVQRLLKLAFTTECQPTTKSKNTSKGELTFISLSSYLKIMHEFQLSPLYITKQSLIDVFRQSIKKSYDFMTFNQFKDSFIIALPFLNDGTTEGQQPETKMIVMLQRINESRGAMRLRKKQGGQKQDYLMNLRQVFKQYYLAQPAKEDYFSNKLESILE